MTKPRDSQRSKVYKAEGRAWRGVLVGHDRAKFPDLEACRKYVAKVCGSKRIQERYPRAAIIAADPIRRLDLHDGGGTNRARGGWRRLRRQGRISLPLFARNEAMILHELAHVLVDSDEIQGHGWEWCEAYLYLVLIVRGRADHDRLKAEFAAGKIRFRKPRAKRELTPEQKAAAIERLRAYHGRAAAGVPETLAFWGLD